MNADTKTKLFVASGAVLAASALIAGEAIRRTVKKHRTCKPLPGTTKVERIVVIKTPKK